MDDMLLGVSILRNKYLANVFYRLKMIEAYGTGIPKIMESYQGYSVEPKIETTDNAFKITLFNTQFKRECMRTPIQKTLFLTEGEQHILNMFEATDIIKRTDIEKELSISQPMAVKYLKSLQEKSAIDKIGNGKNVRYKRK